MHLTRAGFNLAVVIWLLPLVLVDFIGNTTSTGMWSDIYYFKCIFDGLLVAYALYQMFLPATANIKEARARVQNRSDDVVEFENLGAIEYIYCGSLCLYAAGNWFFLHQINITSTGLLSIMTLAWSILSVVVAIVSAVQFWHLKSGSIVELKKRVIQ
jgi:hypothetical protein